MRRDRLAYSYIDEPAGVSKRYSTSVEILQKNLKADLKVIKKAFKQCIFKNIFKTKKVTNINKLRVKHIIGQSNKKHCFNNLKPKPFAFLTASNRRNIDCTSWDYIQPFSLNSLFQLLHCADIRFKHLYIRYRFATCFANAHK